MEYDGNVRVLTIVNYGDDESEVARVTIAPMHVKSIIASTVDEIRFGISLIKTNVLFMDDSMMELHISNLDLTMLESAIGTYIMP